MNIQEYLIVRSHSPSITRWAKKGVILISEKEERNITEMFEINPIETLFFLEDGMEQVENIKHKIQLKEVLDFFQEKYKTLYEF